MTLHPMAYAREAERLGKMARLASAEQDERAAARFRRLANLMAKRSAH